MHVRVIFVIWTLNLFAFDYGYHVNCFNECKQPSSLIENLSKTVVVKLLVGSF